MCIDHGLATPRVLALVCDKSSGLDGTPVVESPSELIGILARAAPYEFVYKPVAGVHGQGLLALRFDGTTFTDSGGTRYSAEDLFAHAMASGYSKWIIQDRIYPHRDLMALAGSDYLQTARVITYVDDHGEVRIPIAWLRIIVGRSWIDNFNFGASGNLVGTIDVATGRLKHVLGSGEPGFGLTQRVRHPSTGAAFADFTVPFMADIRDLVVRAARAFTPLRTIGWDVGITDTGPTLIEGNVTWDPLPTQEDLRAVAASLQ
jgi:hypothetical protein